MVLMAAAMLVVPGIDVIAKLLGSEISVLQIAWSRFLFQSLLLTPIVFYVGSAGWRALSTQRPIAHGLRGLLIGLVTTVFFTALQYMPLADAIAIFFVEPLLLTLLSTLFLGERVGWRRVAAIMIGFVGALLVIQPSFAAVGWPALLPLIAALGFAIYLALTRSLAGDISPLAMQAWAGYTGFATLSLVLAAATAFGSEAGFSWPDGHQWLLLLLLGIIGTGAHLLIAIAFRLAPASVLAPFQYLEIISATLFGWLLFDDFPLPLTWLGIAIIVGSGLFVFWRERRLAE